MSLEQEQSCLESVRAGQNQISETPYIPFTPGLEARTATQRSKAADAHLAAHTVSMKEIEHLTGIDLLPKLDAESLKKAMASELWPRN